MKPISFRKMLESIKPEADEPPRERPRTVDLRPANGEMMKPGEMIDLRDTDRLTLRDRTIYNQLIHNALGPDMAESGSQWTIPLSALRGSHKGNERVAEAIERLMKALCTARLADGKTRRFQLLGGNDMDDEDRPDGHLTYSFDDRLVEVLRNSHSFGKLQLAVMRAFSSKYALALYEYGAKRVNLRYKRTEEHTVEDLRAMLGVPAGKLERFSNLNQKAIRSALQEVNALAEFNLWVEPRRSGRKVTHVVVGWEAKGPLARDEAVRELEMPRVGRKARIKGEVERLELDHPSSSVPM